MKPRLHPCRAEGCQQQIPRGLLMCVGHWRMVPVATRREVLAAWRAGDADRHHDAVVDAVAAVKAKQVRKAEAIAGPSGSLFNP